MKRFNTCLFLSVIMLSVAMAQTASAALMSISATAPTINGADIAMLNVTGQSDAGGDQGHIWSNRPIQGQSFTTGSNTTGYDLSSITLRNFNNTINNNTATWTVRIGELSGTVLSPFASENSNNTISYVPGNYLTFAFASPVHLDPNMIYGFDWDTSGNGFVTANNVDLNYLGGTGYSTGSGGVPAANGSVTLRNVDRVFHIDLAATALPIPEPATATLGLLGLGGLMMRRRRMA